ncbi:MAG: hypothetical protein JWO03_3423 [Bacteroidetes bacterium]|nr:hypothetical protein [Bacteroidota bacterium]
MSTQLSTGFSTSLDDRIKETIKHIDAESENFIEQKVKPQAAILAVTNRPAKGEKIEYFISFISAFYQKLRTDVTSRFQADIQRMLGAFEVDGIETKLNEIRERSAAMQRDLGIHRIEVGELKDVIHTDDLKKHRRILTILFVIEVFIFSTSFIQVGDSYLAGIASGVALALAQTYCLHHVIVFLRDKLKKPLSKITIRLLVLLFALIVLSIGTLRFYSVPEINGHRPIIFLLLFMVITLVIMGYTAFFTLASYPSEVDQKAQLEIDAKRKEIKDQEAAIRELEAEASALKGKRAAIAVNKTRIMQAEHTLLDRVRTCFEEATGVFRIHNVHKRTDGIVPDAFHQHFTMSERGQFQIPSDNNQNVEK